MKDINGIVISDHPSDPDLVLVNIAGNAYEVDRVAMFAEPDPDTAAMIVFNNFAVAYQLGGFSSPGLLEFRRLVNDTLGGLVTGDLGATRVREIKLTDPVTQTYQLVIDGPGIDTAFDISHDSLWNVTVEDPHVLKNIGVSLRKGKHTSLTSGAANMVRNRTYKRSG